MSRYNHSYLLLVSLVSAMGGLLFGYDYVVIGGATVFYEACLGITSKWMQSWAVSSAVIGCLIGVMAAGSLADRFGRKRLLLLAALLFIISAVGTGMVNDTVSFVTYRIIGGVGIGLASNLSPMYIAEISPGEVRGRFVSLNQLTIVLGILFAQIVNWLIAEPVVAGEAFVASWNVQWGWRWMFWAELVPATLFFVAVFFIPESPRWLALRGRRETATSVLSRIGGKDYAVHEMASITDVVREKTDYRTLFQGRMPFILLIGVVLAVFQQWCGINVIFNYAHDIFSDAGYSVSQTMMQIVITGVTNVIFTFVGMYTVDRLGRRALLLFGGISLTVVYAILGAGYYFHVTGLPMLILVVLTIACYAMTLAPVVWVVLSEIFPTRIRGAAMAISTFALWAACFLLTYTFPSLRDGLGASGTFWLYGVICLLGFLFVKKFLPETRGKSLEDIEKEIVIQKNR